MRKDETKPFQGKMQAQPCKGGPFPDIPPATIKRTKKEKMISIVAVCIEDPAIPGDLRKILANVPKSSGLQMYYPAAAGKKLFAEVIKSMRDTIT